MTERADHKIKAKWCEHAERYDDMVKEMKDLVKGLESDDRLDEEERSLLSVAFKNVVGSRRSAWRVLKAKSSDESDEKKMKICEEMKVRIEVELKDLCKEVLDLIDDHLIKEKDDDQAKIFFLKMKGDYFRYMVEICAEGEQRTELATSAQTAYDSALNIAKEHLKSTSPIRLGLALNYSVFFYEIKNDSEAACKLAKNAFDEAIADLDNLPDDSYKDSTLIMQLLRDNLTLWQSEMEEGQQQDD